MRTLNSSMALEEEAHECDLLLVSCQRKDRAVEALPLFAKEGFRNRDGWGIGYFSGPDANVVKDLAPALSDEAVHRGITQTADEIRSKTFLCHLRLASCGPKQVVNNHPFKLANRLGGDWLFAHNGTVKRYDLLETETGRILESGTDSARIFEFMLHQMEHWLDAHPVGGIVEAAIDAYQQLRIRLNGTPAKTNLLMSNGKLSFAFLQWRDWWLQRRLKGNAPAYILSTCELNSDRPDLQFKTRLQNDQMLVFADGVLVTQRAIYAGEP